MNCPKCERAAKVMETRKRKDGSLRRRLECVCGFRFSVNDTQFVSQIKLTTKEQEVKRTKYELEFGAKIAEAKRGDRLTYWRGAFCAGPLRQYVMDLTTKKIIVPISKKHGAGDFEYMVEKL